MVSQQFTVKASSPWIANAPAWSQKLPRILDSLKFPSFFSRLPILEAPPAGTVVLPIHGNHKLPPEILDKIFYLVIGRTWYPRVQSHSTYGHIQSILDTLLASSLVCKFWCRAARRVLWQSLSIESTNRLYQITEARSAVIIPTKYMDIDFRHIILDYPSQTSNPTVLDRLRSQICRVVQQTPGLQELFVDGDAQELVRLLCSRKSCWPMLQTLSIHVYQHSEKKLVEVPSTIQLKNLYINNIGTSIDTHHFSLLFQNSYKSLKSLCIKGLPDEKSEYTRLDNYSFYVSNFVNLETLKLVDVSSTMLSILAYVPISVQRLIWFFPTPTHISDIISHIPSHVPHIELAYILRGFPDVNSSEELSLCLIKTINSRLHTIDSLSIFVTPSTCDAGFTYSNMLERDWMKGSKKTFVPPLLDSNAIWLTKKLEEVCKNYRIQLNTNLRAY